MDLLNKHFPKTIDIDIKCYFTDVFDLQEKEYKDGTEGQIQALLNEARDNNHYDCKNCEACLYSGWRDLREQLLAKVIR